MQTRYRILLGVVSSIAVSIAIALAAFSILKGMQIELRQGQIYDEIIEKTHALNILTDAFSLGSDLGDVNQIKGILLTLDGLLKGLLQAHGEEALGRQLQKDNQELTLLIDQILLSDPAMNVGLERERRRMLSSQVWMKVRFISDDTNRLKKLSQERMITAQEKAGAIVIVLIVILALTNGGIYLFSNRGMMRAQKALQKSENLLRTLSDQIPGGAIYQHVQTADGQMHYAYMSAGIERIFGMPAEAIMADPTQFLGLIVEEDRPRLIAAEQQSAREQTLLECEFRQRTVSGEVKWVQCRSMPRRMADGSTIWDGIVVDITERKQAEEALARAHEQADIDRRRLETILEIAPVGVVLIEAATNSFSLINKRAAEIYGTDYEGHDLQDHIARVKLLQPDGVPFPLEDLPVSRAWRGEESHNVEMTIEQASGVRVPLIVNTAPLRDAGEKVITAVVVFDDITDLKKAEIALQQVNVELERRVAEQTAEIRRGYDAVRAERQRFLDMLDTLPVIVDIIRSDHRIEWANHAYREALGNNLGRLCYESQFGRQTPCDECQAFTPLQTGRPHHWEWTLPNGRTFDIHNFPFAAADGSPAVLEMDIDITDQRRAEETLREQNATLEQRVAERTVELQKNEEALRASLQEKEVLLKEIHHRVKNNMQVISSLLDLQSAKITDPQIYAPFRDSQNRIKSMALIHERLYQAPDLVRVDFTNYLQTLVPRLFESYHITPQHISLRIEAGEVSLDVGQAVPCGLIVNELVANALEHAFPQDRHGELYLHLEKTASEVLLVVRDDGVGLPPTVDVGATPSLGLQLVQVLTRQLKGHIKVNRSAGTEFRLRFPWAG